MSITFTEQDRRALENLMQKKQKAEEEERIKKEKETALGKELIASLNETVTQMQNALSIHEAHVAELATRYQGLLPESVEQHRYISGGDEYKAKYEAMKKNYEDLQVSFENMKVNYTGLNKNYKELDKDYEQVKADLDRANDLIARLFNTMEKKPDNFEAYVEWREEKQAAKKNKEEPQKKPEAKQEPEVKEKPENTNDYLNTTEPKDVQVIEDDAEILVNDGEDEIVIDTKDEAQETDFKIEEDSDPEMSKDEDEFFLNLD